MNTIAEIFRDLPKIDRETLMYVFEDGQGNVYIEWTPGRFLGINITDTEEFFIEQSSGYFSEGSLAVKTLKFPVSAAYAPFEEEDG